MKFLKMTPNFNFEILECEKKDAYLTARDGVEGLIERATAYFDLPKGVEAWVNEEGLLLNKEPFLIYAYDGNTGWIAGNTVFTGTTEDGDFDGLTDEQIKQIKKSIENMTHGWLLDEEHGTEKPILYKEF